MCTSKPKVPKATPVIERQAYRSPAPRSSMGSPDAVSDRRRKMAGIVTSAQGITDPASTTRSVLGGDQQLNPGLGGGGGSSVTVATPAIAPTPTPTMAPKTKTSAKPKGNGLSAGAISLAYGGGALGAALRKAAMV